MKPSILFRVIVFFTTITLLVALIGWTALTSWRRTGELQEHLSAQQWKSIQIADHLRQTILSLNIMVLRYAADRETKDWDDFQAASLELGNWIDAQQPIVSLQKERPLLNQIKVVYATVCGGGQCH